MNNTPDNIPDLLDFIDRVYSYRVNEHGPTANGVFWRDADEQLLRLEILLRAIDPDDLNGPITINDLGCGYGALFDIIKDEAMLNGGHYTGYDLSSIMIKHATLKHTDTRATFITSPVATKVADYSFVSGTFNMSMNAEHGMWTDYIQTNLTDLWSKTKKVMAFNLLDKISKQKLGDLYYGNKVKFIDFAHSLSPHVKVLDDYGMDEFTIFVNRKP